jgi:hypothetical protein
MTEYELMDVIVSRFSNMTDQSALYFALVSGYLIAAFFVGARLTRLQVIVVNSLFIMWTVGLLIGWSTALEATLDLDAAIRQLESPTIIDSTMDGAAASAYLFSIVQTIGIIASLIFMWSVRHPKTG